MWLVPVRYRRRESTVCAILKIRWTWLCHIQSDAYKYCIIQCLLCVSMEAVYGACRRNSVSRFILHGGKHVYPPGHILVVAFCSILSLLHLFITRFTEDHFKWEQNIKVVCLSSGMQQNFIFLQQTLILLETSSVLHSKIYVQTPVQISLTYLITLGMRDMELL